MDRYVIIKSYNSLSQLYSYLKNILTDQKNFDDILYNITDEFKIYIKEKRFTQLSEAVAEYLIRNYVFFFVWEIAFDFDTEQEEANNFSLHSLNCSVLRKCKKHQIVKKVKNELEYFSKIYTELNIDGYLLFSFRKYEEFICDCILNEIVIRKAKEEYDNVLSETSEYIRNSPSNLDELNIILHSNCNAEYFDKSHNNIAYDFSIDPSYNTEDEILDILITLNPNKCKIHLKGNALNSNLLCTLNKLFGERIIICKENCSFCNL